MRICDRAESPDADSSLMNNIQVLHPSGNIFQSKGGRLFSCEEIEERCEGFRKGVLSDETRFQARTRQAKMNRLLLQISLLLLLVSAGMAAYAGEPDVKKAVPPGTVYASSFEECKALAEQGDAEAQFRLAAMYGDGRAIPQDHAEELKWYRKAAEQGMADAQYNLGYMYSAGLGTSQDHAEAMKWYRKAADQKHMEAQYALGLMYGSGTGVAPDPVQEAAWYRKAANQGHGDAQFNLGIMFAKGEGVPQSYLLAYIWFHLASYKKIEHALDYRERCAAQLTLSEITEAQNLARAWRAQ